MSACSLFYDWTERSPNNVPVTEFVEHLIQLIGRQVCTFKRNPQVSYRFVDTARSLVKRINELISMVENNPESNESAFELWTNAIEPLENVLLAFTATDDLSQDEEISDPDSVRIQIDLWSKNRKDIRNALNKFSREEHLKELGVLPEKNSSDLKAAYMYDDRAYLNDLVIKIKNRVVQDRLSAFPYKQHIWLREISGGVSEIFILFGQANGLPEGSEAMVTQSMMAVYGFLELGSNLQVSSKTRMYLISKAVCREAKLLVDDLIALCKGKRKLEQVQVKYEAFLELLAGEAEEELPASYYELMKQVAKIGRSHHAQSLLLLTFCRESVKHYQSLQGGRSVHHYVVIQNACDKTLDTLRDVTEKLATSAGAFSLSNLFNFDPEAYRTHTCTELFATTTAALKGHSDELGIATVDVEKTYEKRLVKAVSQDTAQLVAARDRITKTKKDILAADDAELVDVTVKVRLAKESGNNLGELKVKVQHSVLLSALGWGASQKPDLEGQTMGKGVTFEEKCDESSSGWRPVSSDKTVGSLAKQNQNTLELRMVVSDPKPAADGSTPHGGGID